VTLYTRVNCTVVEAKRASLFRGEDRKKTLTSRAKMNNVGSLKLAVVGSYVVFAVNQCINYLCVMVRWPS
jgi:hypothetical protein